MTTRLIARLVALCTVLFIVAPSLGGGPAPARAAAATKTYSNATFRYSFQYPASWVLSARTSFSPSKPEPKLPKQGLTLSTPGSIPSGNVVGLVGILVTPNRFSSAEIAELERNYLTTNNGFVKPIQRRTQMIQGVAFREASAVLRVDPKQNADAAILTTRHGAYTYVILLATILGQKHTAQIAVERDTIVNSIRLH